MAVEAAAAPLATARLEARSREDHRWAAMALGASIWLLPVLRPGLGTVRPADLAIVGSTAVVVLWLGWSRVPLRMPFAASMTLFGIAGLVAASVSGHATIGIVAVVQDLVLLAWCLAIANVCRTPETLAIVVRAWAWSATVAASVVIVGAVAGLSALSGQEIEGGRASLAFDNPNQAGAYFACAFFVILSAGAIIPRRRRFVMTTIVVAAVLFAASNAAIGGILLGLVVVGILAIARRRGVASAIAAASIAALVVAGAAVAFVRLDVAETAGESDIRLLRNTLGRGSESAGDRVGRWESLGDAYLQYPVSGYGAAATKAVLDEGPFNDAKGAHNDYAAALAERGLLGSIALILLIASITTRMGSIAVRPLTRGFAAVLGAPHFLAGALVVLAISSLTHEILHFRNVWVLLGLVAAVSLWSREDVASPAAARTIGAGGVS
ncbi:MAG TPA: O-antigen ligase family protein [Actinomycetota bacterium]|nr:O-antigen ligase family protein [Actinomycetota bacterium]